MRRARRSTAMVGRLLWLVGLVLVVPTVNAFTMMGTAGPAMNEVDQICDPAGVWTDNEVPYAGVTIDWWCIHRTLGSSDEPSSSDSPQGNQTQG